MTDQPDLRAPDNARMDARVGERGYSLLEVLIVLTIIALIATLTGPRLLAQLDRSKVTAARVQVRSIMSSLEAMRLDIGRYPTDDEGLQLLVKPPQTDDTVEGWQGPYMETAIPNDPWGHPYKYVGPQDEQTAPVVKSLGSDGREGGSGLAADVSNAGAH